MSQRTVHQEIGTDGEAVVVLKDGPFGNQEVEQIQREPTVPLRLSPQVRHELGWNFCPKLHGDHSMQVFLSKRVDLNT